MSYLQLALHCASNFQNNPSPEKCLPAHHVQKSLTVEMRESWGVARRETKINIYQKQCSLVHIPSYPYIGAAMISKFSKDFGASIVTGWKVKKRKRCISVMGPDAGGQNHKYFCGDPRAEAKNSLAKKTALQAKQFLLKKSPALRLYLLYQFLLTQLPCSRNVSVLQEIPISYQGRPRRNSPSCRDSRWVVRRLSLLQQPQILQSVCH